MRLILANECRNNGFRQHWNEQEAMKEGEQLGQMHRGEEDAEGIYGLIR
jgi:hypothetical protein